MYKSILYYPYGNGKRVLSICKAKTMFGLKVKTWFMKHFGNKGFFTVEFSAE